MKWVGKAAYVVAKIVEVVCWIGVAVLALIFILSITSSDRLQGWYEQGTLIVDQSEDLGAMDALAVINAEGELNATGMTWFCVVSLPFVVLIAVVFHKICGAIKLTWSGSPFQEGVVRRVRQIGYLFAAMAVVQFIAGLVMRIVLRGGSAASYGLDLEGVVTTLIVLWLTQVFAYGAELQNDVEGLL